MIRRCFRNLAQCLAVLGVTMLTACDSTDTVVATTPADDPAALNQVLLGPIVEAQLDAALTSDVDSIIETTTTVDADTVMTAGAFDLVLDGVADDQFVLVTVSGGNDIDADDDGVRDTTPTTNAGIIRGLATAADWRSGGNITVLSEITVRQLVGTDTAQLENLSNENIGQALNNVARRLLAGNSDPNADGETDYRDLLAYSPYLEESVTQSSDEEITRLAQLIESGTDDAGVDTLAGSFVAPLAIAGDDLAVASATLVELNGSASAVGTITDFVWAQVSGPAVQLQNPETATASFSAPPAATLTVLEFVLTVTEEGGATASDTIEVTVTSATASTNTAPSATAQNVTTTEDTATAIVLAGTDADGTISATTIATQPTNGILTGTAPDVTYTPGDGFTGTDQFTFTVTDNNGSVSVAATVVITVQGGGSNPGSAGDGNQRPVANSDSFDTSADSVLDITLTGTDVDGSIVGFTVITLPGNGTITGTSHNIQYQPNANFTGLDELQFIATDNEGAESLPATIGINVVAISMTPVVSAGAGINVESEDSVMLSGSVSNLAEGSATPTFSWEELSDFGIVLSGADTATPLFTAPVVEVLSVLRFELTAANSDGVIGTDIMTVTVHPEITGNVTSGMTGDFTELVLQSPDGRFSITIPAGAAPPDTEVSMTQLNRDEINELEPDSGPQVSVLYALSPANLLLSSPASVRYRLSKEAETEELQEIATSPQPDGAPSASNGVYKPGRGEVVADLIRVPELAGTIAGGLHIRPPSSVLHYVGLPRNQFFVFLTTVSRLDDVEHDLEFGIRTGSGTDHAFTPSIIAPLELDEDNGVSYEGRYGVVCNSHSIDRVVIRYVHERNTNIGTAFKLIPQKVELLVPVTCIDESLQPSAIELAVGNAVEAAKRIARNQVPTEEETQALYEKPNYVATSRAGTFVFSPDGITEAPLPGQDIDANFGALIIQNPNSGVAWLFQYGAGGKFVSPFLGGFGFGDPPGFNPTYTAEYMRDVNGERRGDAVLSVRNGRVEVTSPRGESFSETEVFNGMQGQLPDTSQPLFGCDSLDHRRLACITENGFLYGIDTFDESTVLIADNLGSELRDVQCEPIDTRGSTSCLVASFGEGTATHCSGNAFDLGSFSCNATINTGSSVSIGVAPTRNGTLAAVFPGFDTGGLTLAEITSAGTLVRNISITAPDIQTIPGLEDAQFANPGHAELDAENNNVVVTDNTSGTALVIPIVLLADLPNVPDEIAGWFRQTE